MMELKKLSIDDPWMAGFMAAHGASVFDLPGWLAVLRDGFDSDVAYYALCDGTQPKIALSAILLDLKFVRIAYSNIPYGGLIGDVSAAGEFIGLLEPRLRESGAHIFRITRQYTSAFNSFEGYAVQPGSQQVIPIAGLTESVLWEGYKKRVRRDVRRAQKLGLAVRPIQERGEVETLFEIYRSTMRRNATYTTWPKKAFYAIYDRLLTGGEATIYFAMLEGRHVAGVILIHSPDTTYYFMSASLTDYLSYCPNDLLLHETICQGIRRGCAWVDLMTSRASDTDLAGFKDKWGAQQHPFFIYEKNLNRARALVWNAAWKVANSRPGGALVRMVRR